MLKKIGAPKGWLVAAILIVAAFSYVLGQANPNRARAEEGFLGGVMVNTAGILSSNGATAVHALAIPTSFTAPTTHRFWVGGLTIFNSDTVTHYPTLVCRGSGRVIWGAPLPANGGVIIDNTNYLSTDVGTPTGPEGVDLVCEVNATNKVGIVGTGYYK